ncbi:MAG: TetR/AcrR family transcriptional regulator [Actinomycetaceae bacterium]|nr:TetR/AcrR family transcriptional regulator [Actinomycetaceae bacterium]
MTSRNNPTARRVGITREKIVEQALSISSDKGLESWSIRDLAVGLDVVPSVIYHYYSSKENIVDEVVDRIVAQVPLPCIELEWKEWLQELLIEMEPVLLRYHGAAHRMMLGKMTPGIVPVVDTALLKLAQAGFGPMVPIAYSIIFNAVVSTVAARQMRCAQQVGDRHDLDAMLMRLRPMAVNSPGLKVLIDHLFEPLSDQQHAEEVSKKYYRLVVQCVLDGVEKALLPNAEKNVAVTGRAKR